jgi:hypothetical protein
MSSSRLADWFEAMMPSCALMSCVADRASAMACILVLRQHSNSLHSGHYLPADLNIFLGRALDRHR